MDGSSWFGVLGIRFSFVFFKAEDGIRYYKVTGVKTCALPISYGDIQQSDDGANAEYNGLLASLNKRFSHNFTILSNYTFSHCISSWDFAGELAGVIYQNPLNRASGERGNCGFDHRHVFNTSIVVTSAGIGTGALKAITA